MNSIGSDAPPEMVKLRHRNAASCFYAGRIYEPDENGEFVVPADADEALQPHGFVRVPVPTGVGPKPDDAAVADEQGEA